MGYHRAGFDVTGVDIAPQPHYPFRFIQADALDFELAGYDVIHASPPCQEYTALHALHRHKSYPDLIALMRGRLQAAGTPWIMENIPLAPLAYSVMLCGSMFALRVYRHRHFETSWLMWQAGHPKHTAPTGSGRGQRQRKAHYLAGGNVTVTGNIGSYCGPAMGIEWMTGEELSQAIPPAYTEWIGRQIMSYNGGG